MGDIQQKYSQKSVKQYKKNLIAGIMKKKAGHKSSAPTHGASSSSKPSHSSSSGAHKQPKSQQGFTGQPNPSVKKIEKKEQKFEKKVEKWDKKVDKFFDKLFK